MLATSSTMTFHLAKAFLVFFLSVPSAWEVSLTPIITDSLCHSAGCC